MKAHVHLCSLKAFVAGLALLTVQVPAALAANENEKDCPSAFDPGSENGPQETTAQKKARQQADRKKRKEEQKAFKKAEKKRLQEESEAAEQAERIARGAKLREPLTEAFGQDGLEAQLYRDHVVANWIKKLEFTRMVSMLLGNPYRAPTETEAANFAQLVSGVTKYANTILYDADSLAAKIVSDAAGDKGLGVTHDLESVKSKGLHRVVEISNPFLRLSVFNHPIMRTVMSPDSLTGLGLAFEEHMKYVFDPTSKWTQGLLSFDRSIPHPPLGINYKYSEAPSLVSSANYAVDLITKFTFSPRPDNLNFDPAHAISIVEDDEVRVLIKRGKSYTQGIDQMKNLPGGAAVFGSGKKEDRYTALVYETARALAEVGVPIATGGSGGFMSVANAAAFDAGGHSIGIPITGKGKIKSEAVTAIEVQTVTIDSDSYATRIPMLLHRRQLVLLAPGGSGTMKELATLLVAWGSGTNSHQQLILIDGDYYSVLTKWLKSGALPESVTSRIHLISKKDDIVPVLTHAIEQAGDTSELRTELPPTPRRKRSSK